MLKEKTQKLVQHIVIHHIECVKLKDFYSIEAMGVQCYPKCGSCKCGSCPIGGKNYTLREKRELNLIDKGLRHEDGYWVAKYPWIKDPNNLLDNKQAVMGMLKSTEKRLSKNRKHAEMYQQQIDDMIQRKVARKLPVSELEEYRGPIHYISHHEVLKPDSESTPCHIVFNSSAKFQGHTLNEYFAKGPDLLNNLLGVLVRFRENRIAISGDIRKMYHAVKIDSIDQHTHRFLWRNMEIEREPDVYVITSVSFGDKPAGNIATLALRKTAEMGKETYPKAANVIQNSTYVDNVIDSVDSLNEAKELTEDIVRLLQPGGLKSSTGLFTVNVNLPDLFLRVIQVLVQVHQKAVLMISKVISKITFIKLEQRALIKRCWVLHGILRQIHFISVCKLTFHQKERK